MPEGPEPNSYPFLLEGGEMGARMRAYDWVLSPLGPPDRWPQSLRSVVGVMLTSKFPMFLAWGPELACLYNDAYCPILGGKHPQALGRPFAQVWSEIWHDIHPLVERALAGEATYYEDLPLTMRRKGFEEQTYFTFSYSPLRDESGQVAGMFCVCTETTQNVLAERERAAETTRLRHLFRQAPGFMAVVRGPQHVFELANEAYLQVVGNRDLLGKPAREALPEVEGQGFFELLDTVYRTGEPFVGYGLPIKLQRRPDAPLEDRFITFVHQPIRDADGRVTGVFAEGHDVTEAKLAEIELRRLNETLEQRVAERTAEREEALAHLAQAQKMEAVGQLTGGVAHDFNNLLQAMTGCLKMIERRAPLPAIKPLIEAGRQAVDRGAKLVQQLMAFARRQALRPEPVDVRDRVLGMSELLTRALRANIRVDTKFGPGLWPILVDPTQFELALINLAVNARDAMPAGGQLRIEASNLPAVGEVGDRVCISVSDTGSGMDAGVLARAFEPFFTTKRLGEGSGLGLAQVYGFARQSGGSVEIGSQPGRGTTVRLLLPRASVAAPSRSAERPASGDVTLGARVLLVEDDPVVASTMAAALEDVGYEVARVTTADEAVPLLASRARIDVLFSDVVMPGRLSGVALVHEARRLRPGLPIVLTTGYSEEVAQVSGIQVLTKPYQVDELIGALEAALAKATSNK